MFPNSLRREVFFLLCIKVAVLIFIYYTLIAPLILPEPDGITVAKHLLSGSGI
jgi:hypothetical protein